mgnify:CR=1 FL=1
MAIHTTKEIISRLKELTNDKHDIDLADRLGVCKQSLSQYKNKNSKDLQLRIISLLIDIIEDKSKND